MGKKTVLFFLICCFIAGLSGTAFKSEDHPALKSLVWVEGGTFEMGCDSGSEGERPVHQVKVGSFGLGRTEVTVAEYVAFLNESGREYDWVYREESHIEGEVAAYRVPPGQENYPVVYVSWGDAQAYLRWLSQKTGRACRLPTEAEWEYAARGGQKSKGYAYSGCDKLSAVAWYRGNAAKGSRPVGQKAANELGLHDMSGNVWEWCQDWYGHEYYAESSREEPKGPERGARKVLRGGSWQDIPERLVTTRRMQDSPDYRSDLIGFRVLVEDFQSEKSKR